MGNKKSFPAHFPYPAPPDADAELPGSPTFADAGSSSIILSPVPHTQPPILKDRVNHQRLRQQTKRKSKNVVRWRAKLDKHRPEIATEVAAGSVVLTGPNLFEDLPDEILCHLLGFLFQDTKVALLPSPVAAMLVCSRWYRVIDELQLSPVALPWRRRRDEIVFRRRPDYVKRKVFTTAKRSKYEGEWVEEFGKHGKGKLKYPDGDMYQGEWLKDKRHGYGVYIWSSGHTYSGEWFHGERHGKGTYTSPCGNYYTGSWKNNKRHGQGLWIDSRGTRYEGEYADGRAHGFGVMLTPLGSWYKGQWVDGSGHGWGVYAYSNGDRYEGQWVQGKREGWGVYTYTNGDTYYGWWAAGIQNGRGTHYFTSAGGKYEGTWKDGHPEEVEESTGVLTLDDGRRIESKWEEIPMYIPSAKALIEARPLSSSALSRMMALYTNRNTTAVSSATSNRGMPATSLSNSGSLGVAASGNTNTTNGNTSPTNDNTNTNNNPPNGNSAAPTTNNLGNSTTPVPPRRPSSTSSVFLPHSLFFH